MDTKSGLQDVPSRGYPREGTSLFYLNKMVYFWIETLVYFSIEINTQFHIYNILSLFFNVSFCCYLVHWFYRVIYSLNSY